jgi:hypothetical protein
LTILAYLPIAQGAVIQNPPVSIIRVGLDPCIAHPSNHCLVELDPEPAVLLPAGGSAFYQAVMGADYPAWTVANGGALNATYNITTYDAYNDCPTGGAEIRIMYVPGPGTPAPVRWSQAIFTNHRRGGVEGVWASYMDVIAGSADPFVWDPPAYPYQYTDSQFYDKPSRPCPAGGFIRWDGEAYPTAIDYTTQTITVYEGVEWGFWYWCWPKTTVTAMPTIGSTGTVLTYDPGLQALSIYSPSINILNLSGGNEFSPMFASDPLQMCSLTVEGLHWKGPQPGGGYLFRDGMLTIRAPGNLPILSVALAGVLVDDTMQPESGFNIVGIYGDFTPAAPFGSPLLQMYNNTLQQGQIPQFVLSTVGSFSSRLGDGTQFVSANGALKNGFALPQPPWYDKGDLNGDGLVNAHDLQPFITLLLTPDIYHINYPDVPGMDTGDINGDGAVNGLDIQGFMDLILRP